MIFKTIKRKYQGPSNPNKIRLNESKFRVFTEILSAHHRSGRNIGTRCNEIQFTWTVRRRAGTMRRPRTTSDWRWLSANGQMWPVIDYLLDFCWWYRRIKKNTHTTCQLDSAKTKTKGMKSRSGSKEQPRPHRTWKMKRREIGQKLATTSRRTWTKFKTKHPFRLLRLKGEASSGTADDRK